MYSVDLSTVTFKTISQGTPDVVVKTLEVDLMTSGAFAPFAGAIPEKIEGMTVLSSGDVMIVNDNDGVDDNSGETRLLTLPGTFQ